MPSKRPISMKDDCLDKDYPSTDVKAKVISHPEVRLAGKAHVHAKSYPIEMHEKIYLHYRETRDILEKK